MYTELTMRVVVLLGIVVALPGQPAKLSPAEQLIEQQLRGLRSLPDDTRAVTTKRLAEEIRKLSAGPNQLMLAEGLSGYSTEGDFGRNTLLAVATTLAQAIREQHGAKGDAYTELARLVHYEHVPVTLDDPQFRAALAQADADDRIRQESDFTLHDLDGKSWTLQQLRGKVVLVNFWATWCPPCRKEMPDLEKLYRRFASQGLLILAISDEGEGKVRPYIERGKYSYPILLDPGRKVNERFHIEGIPKSLVYDRAGKLAAQSPDMRTMSQFVEMLAQAGLR